MQTMRTMRGLLMAVCLLLPALAQNTPRAAAQSGAPPAGAQEVSKDTFRYKDSDGVVWIYRKKPFGWAKAREADEQAIRETPKPEGTPVNQPSIKVVAVKGDAVSFEMPSAFGKRSWSSRKADLTPDEKAALDKWEAAQTARPKK